MNRRLYRSRTDTVIGGVAAGLADYLNADPALIRIAWAILVVVTGGAALIVYIVCWIVVPEEPEIAAVGARHRSGDRRGHRSRRPRPRRCPPRRGARAARRGWWSASVSCVIGVWFLLREYLPDINWGLLWPLVLVGIGALILVTSMRRRAG